MVIAVPHFVQRCSGVDVPKNFQGVRRRMLDYSLNEFIVENADAARLDDHVGRSRFG